MPDASAATIHSLQVGMPQTFAPADGSRPPWRSGIVKAPVEGPVRLGPTALNGDGQADLKHHGGPDKALCVYPLVHYGYWAERLAEALPPAAFGENLTVTGQDERAVCVGDVVAVGEARVQVSQPRSPCWKLGERRGEPRLPRWVQQTGFTGWYLRVLRPGRIEAGQTLVLEQRPYPEWTIQRVNALRYRPSGDREAAARLADCDALTASWREHFRRLAAGQAVDETARLTGNAPRGRR